MADEKKYLDDLDQEVKEAGGGGMICEAAVFGGFNVFAGGVSPVDSTFLFATIAEKPKAAAKAKEMAEQHGCGSQETRVLVCYKGTALTHDSSAWKDDLYRTFGPTWGPDVKDVFNPRRVELGIVAGKRYWMRIGAMTSPNAEANPDESWAVEKGEDGEERLKLIYPPVAVFGMDKEGKEKAEEAAAAFGSAEAAVSDPSYPGEEYGWKTYEDWVGVKEDIVKGFYSMADEIGKELKDDDKWSGKPKKVRKKEAEKRAKEQIAEDFSATEEHVTFVLAEAAGV